MGYLWINHPHISLLNNVFFFNRLTKDMCKDVLFLVIFGQISTIILQILRILLYNKSMGYNIESPQKPQLNYREMSQAELAAHCEKQDQSIAELTQSLNRLIEMIRLNNHRKYGASGDSVNYADGMEQLCFFNEAEATAIPGKKEPTFEEVTAKTPRKPKQKGKREQDFKDLNVTVIEHELPAEQQVCPTCDNPLHEMKVEVTKTLKLVPAHFEVEEHRRHVYTCRACEKTQGEGDKLPFIRAYMPNLPIPGSFATPELIAGIINSKYTNALPLARIEREFDRMDSVRISRQNMSNWILQCSEEYFSKIYTHMRSTLLSKDVLHADDYRNIYIIETGLQLAL